MAAKSVEFHEEASEEAVAAFAWYRERSETVAVQFSQELARAIQWIANAPRR